MFYAPPYSQAGLEAYTVGQGARISHDRQSTTTTNKAQRAANPPPADAVKWFVCGKDLSANAVLVCPGSGHPALYSDHLDAQPLVPLTAPLHSRLRGSSSGGDDDCSTSNSIDPSTNRCSSSSSSSSSSNSGSNSSNRGGFDSELHVQSSSSISVNSMATEWLNPGENMRCLFRVRHRQELAWATVTPAAKNTVNEKGKHLSSSNCGSSGNSSGDGSNDSSSISDDEGSGGIIVFDEPIRAVTAGQHVALYLPAHRDITYEGNNDGNNHRGENPRAEAPAAWTANGAQAYRCLGGGAIARAGPSYWAQEKALPAAVKSWAMS